MFKSDDQTNEDNDESDQDPLQIGNPLFIMQKLIKSKM